MLASECVCVCVNVLPRESWKVINQKKPILHFQLRFLNFKLRFSVSQKLSITSWQWIIGNRRTIKRPWNYEKKGKRTNSRSYSVSEVFSTEFVGFHFISLTFTLSDHPSPLLRQMSGSRVPERAISIRIINIISFHCDSLCSPLHTQGQDAANTVATVSSGLSI